MDTIPTIGIDLGSSKHCIALVDQGIIQIVANELGGWTTPSYVSFNEDERLIGNSAKNQAIFNASNTVFAFKRLIGRRVDDPVITGDCENLPFKILDVYGKPKVQVNYKGKSRAFYLEEIAAMLMGHMKLIAENFLRKPVSHAVITVPACFTTSQRQATMNAATIAGLNVIRLLNEPTAAAIAYAWNHPKNCDDNFNLLIFDFGGSKLDLAVIKMTSTSLLVQSTAGYSNFGGRDLDNRLIDYCFKKYQEIYKSDLKDDRRARWRLEKACEQAKRQLSSASQATINVDSIDMYENNLNLTITRETFEKLREDLFEAIRQVIRQVLVDGCLKPSEINQVLLVGGSTRIPKVRELIQDELKDGDQTEARSSKLNHTLNPDEAVASGAAIQAALLIDGQFERKLTVQEVSPLSIFRPFTSNGGKLLCVIPKNSVLPISQTQILSPRKANQSFVKFRIYEGLADTIKENDLIGVYMSTPHLIRGKPRMEVIFTLDLNCLLTVKVIDMDTRETTVVEVAESMNIPPHEMKQLIKEAENLQLEDLERRKKIEAKNNLEILAFGLKQCLMDMSSTLEYTLQWIDSISSGDLRQCQHKKFEFLRQINSICRRIHSLGAENGLHDIDMEKDFERE